jgi:hypothetical protein
MSNECLSCVDTAKEPVTYAEYHKEHLRKSILAYGSKCRKDGIKMGLLCGFCIGVGCSIVGLHIIARNRIDIDIRNLWRLDL